MNAAFVILFFIFPILFYVLLRGCGERLMGVSLVSFAFTALIVFSYVGILPLYFYWDDYRFSTGVQNREVVFLIFIYSSLAVSLFLMGVAFTRRVAFLKPIAFSFDKGSKLKQIDYALIVFLLLVSFAFFLEYMSRINSIALVVALTEGSESSKVVRSQMGNDFTGSYHFFRFFMYDLSQFIAYTLFAAWLICKNKMVFIFFMLSFSYAFFLAIMATEKATLAWFIIGLFLVYSLVRWDGKVNLRYFIFFVSIVLMVLSTLYLFFMGSTDIGTALASIFSRAFTGSISPAYFYLEYFPEYQEYLMGRTFPNPGGILPYVPVRYTVEIMNWKFPELAESGIVGSMPTVFWAEAYANFGVWGIPIIAFLMGVFFSVISWLVSKLVMTPFVVAYYVWLILILKNISVSGFSGFFINIDIFMMSAILLILISYTGRLKLRRIDSCCA